MLIHSRSGYYFIVNEITDYASHILQPLIRIIKPFSYCIKLADILQYNIGIYSHRISICTHLGNIFGVLFSHVLGVLPYLMGQRLWFIILHQSVTCQQCKICLGNDMVIHSQPVHFSLILISQVYRIELKRIFGAYT